MTKIAALGPAIDALEQTPTNASKAQFFEQHVTDQAYQAFDARHPDLTESIVTFKMVTSDPDAGTAVGAFILDLAGEAAYVPVTFHADEVSPLDILFVVNKGTFVPFTQEWVEEVLRNSSQGLGEAQKLPPTVATDMDIRNLVVPPTTGRYSYASAVERGTPEQKVLWKIAADSTHPLGVSMCKRAEEAFDPGMWEGFVAQFSQLNGMTPGVALDQGQMDMNIMSKMYKSYVKTWMMPQEAAAAGAGGMAPGGQPGAQPGMAPGAAPQQPPAPGPNMQQPGAAAPAPMAPGAAQAAPGQMPAADPMKMGSAASQGLFARLGGKADDLAGVVAENAALGGLGGALTSVYDDDYSDMGSRALKGSLGGTLGGTLGRALGGRMNTRYPQLEGLGDEIGQLAGLGIGSISAARPGSISNALRPNSAPQQDPYGGMYRYAAFEDPKPMFKHAFAEPHERPLRLLDYLERAPNNVKTAFATVLKKHVPLLKLAAQIYGDKELVAALKPRAKVAGQTPEGGLKIVRSTDGVQAFGPRAGAAFRGVAMRGYYYEDDGKRPARNQAVIKQEYHDAHDAREPGVYLLWAFDGKRVPALIVQDPLDLENSERQYSPKNTSQVKPVITKTPGTFATHPEPDSKGNLNCPEPDVERSHKSERLVLLGDGRNFTVDQIVGEQMTEKLLEGTPLYGRVWGNKTAKVASGYGAFIWQTGSHYYATKPVTLAEIATSADGVITGKFRHGKRFRIDPRSPMKRPVRPRDSGYVLIPASWRWVPLKDMPYESRNDFITTPSQVIDLGMNAMGAMGARKVRVDNAGARTFSVRSALSEDKGPLEKSAAIKYLADLESISGADAEACVKLAELERSVTAHIIPKPLLSKFAALVKRADPAMDQALGETLGGLEQQVAQLQSQLQVLQTVQQRAQEIASGGGMAPTDMQQTDPAMPAAGGTPAPAAPATPAPGAPMDPNAAAGAPPAAPAPAPMDPAAAQAPADPNAPPADPNAAPADPNAAPMDPAMQDPNAQGMPPQQPPLPMMPEEGPSSDEIALQMNPEFLGQAASMKDQGVFDMSAITDLEGAAQRAGNSPSPLGDHKDNLVATIDDLGRTLLLLQIRAPELEAQLGSEGFKTLEEQARNTFLGLGQLQSELKQNSTALVNAQGTNSAA